jgi:hypothetical protein
MKLPSTATPEMCGMQSVQKLGYHFRCKQRVKWRVKNQYLKSFLCYKDSQTNIDSMINFLFIIFIIFFILIIFIIFSQKGKTV